MFGRHSYFPFIAALVALAALTGCKPPSIEKVPETPTPTPTPATPTPKPTPIYIPDKRMEVSKLFNGMQVRTTLETEPGTTATDETEVPGSYQLDISVKVKVPRANQDLVSLSKLNPALAQVLPGLPGFLASSRVSDFYEELYRRKLNMLRRDLTRLDALLSRHNFFDCETILELENPGTKRKAVLLQADMDVDMDGSDSDRIPNVDGSSAHFQPMTSYRWPKKTTNPNPFLPSRQTRLQTLEREIAAARGLGAERVQALKDTAGAARYEVNQLMRNSFLVASLDPYVVLPGIMFDEKGNNQYSPQIGDFCIVIYQDHLYPAVVGDVGPNFQVGEASYRIAKEINARSTADNRAVTPLKVSYLIFPHTAEKPFGPPDFQKWYAKADTLLKEFGGYNGKLQLWEDLTPKPTPTPTPSPTGSASPGVTGTATQTPSITGTAAGSVTPSASPSATPTPVPLPTGSASPSVIPVASGTSVPKF